MQTAVLADFWKLHESYGDCFLSAKPADVSLVGNQFENTAQQPNIRTPASPHDTLLFISPPPPLLPPLSW